MGNANAGRQADCAECVVEVCAGLELGKRMHSANNNTTTVYLLVHYSTSKHPAKHDRIRWILSLEGLGQMNRPNYQTMAGQQEVGIETGIILS